MKILIPQRARLAGFSLVEMAIVLLITGILMSAGLSLLTLKMEAAYQDATRKNQEVIKQALINYLGINKRLPCPSGIDGTELPRTASPTGSTPPPCTSYSGIVPYKEIGLDRSSALDGWENFITYVVSQNITPTPPPFQTTPSAQQIAPAPVLTTAWVYSYSTATTSSTAPYTKTNTTNPPNPWGNPLTPLLPTPTIANDSAFWPSTSSGGIKVTDGGTTIIADPALATGAVVTLISHGKNGFGAINIKGGANDSTSAGTDEKKNISPTSIVPATVVKRDQTETTDGGYFDDVVMIISANDLTGPLVANGTLQASAQAALNQANDIVLGYIVANKQTFFCPAPPPYPANCDQPGITTYAMYTLPASCTPQSTVPPCSIFPASVLTWGVGYTQVTSPIYLNTSPSTNIAYILTSGDGAKKVVSIGELQGILGQAARF